MRARVPSPSTWTRTACESPFTALYRTVRVLGSGRNCQGKIRSDPHDATRYPASWKSLRVPAKRADTRRPADTSVLPPLLVASGAAALAYEVLWARDWALLYGSTATGTAVVLAVYFAGLAAGAALG